MSASILPLVVEAAEVRRKGVRLIGPVSCRIAGDGVTIVIGPNGAGKTNFLRLLHGLERATAGSISWAKPPETARRRQAFVFQSPVTMRRNVTESIAFPLRLDGMSRARANARAADWAIRVGLGPMLDRRAGVLSRGERQKLALVRALIREPDVLFLDEPCASLDGAATREIEAILCEARANGTRIVMATHDMGQARRLADEVIFIHQCGIKEFGPAPAFFTDPQTEEARAFLRGDILP